MARRLTLVSVVLAVFTALLALLLVVAAPALANHRDGHDKDVAGERDHDGDADSDPNTADEGVDDNKHPSGKDRSEEKGGSGNQGGSESDPDDDGRGPDRSNGGPDKPGGSGGVDQDDQDGNNGCGNDDDFEDDNEGWCGKPPKDDDDVASDQDNKGPCDADANMAGIQSCDEEDDDVLGDDDTATDVPDVLGVKFGAEGEVKAVPEVLGQRTRGGVLPFTGGQITGFVFLALGLVAAGYLMLRARRRV